MKRIGKHTRTWQTRFVMPTNDVLRIDMNLAHGSKGDDVFKGKHLLKSETDRYAGPINQKLPIRNYHLEISRIFHNKLAKTLMK